MKQFISLEHKKFLVVGASTGIGASIAAGCAELGAEVYVAARRNCSIDSHQIKNINTDIRKPDEIRELAKKIDVVDGIVYSAGRSGLSPINSLDEDMYNDVLDTNLNGYLFTLKEILRARKIKNGGSIVAISSIAAHTGTEGLAPYTVSKAGISAVTKVLARELAKRKIRVNAISPAMVRTPIFEKDGPEYLNEIEKRVYPLGLGAPEDVAAASIFYLSDQSSYITGTDLIMSGGCTWV
jgi:NAD(P)-dependent dehydrogenase (short-subunit alcohol dehydrogenase family)